MKSTFPYTGITFQSGPDFNTDFLCVFVYIENDCLNNIGDRTEVQFYI